jgi:hypothetical protein
MRPYATSVFGLTLLAYEALFRTLKLHFLPVREFSRKMNGTKVGEQFAILWGVEIAQALRRTAKRPRHTLLGGLAW